MQKHDNFSPLHRKSWTKARKVPALFKRMQKNKWLFFLNRVI